MRNKCKEVFISKIAIGCILDFGENSKEKRLHLREVLLQITKNFGFMHWDAI